MLLRVFGRDTNGTVAVATNAGDTLFAPRGIPHTYRCVGKSGGKLSVVLTPSDFEDFFAEVGALSSQEQQNIPRVMQIDGRYGLEILPPPRIVN